jgi:hypothetical protein
MWSEMDSFTQLETCHLIMLTTRFFFPSLNYSCLKQLLTSRFGFHQGFLTNLLQIPVAAVYGSAST